MYRISRHIINAEAPVPHIPGLEGGHNTQSADICYFVQRSGVPFGFSRSLSQRLFTVYVVTFDITWIYTLTSITLAVTILTFI